MDMELELERTGPNPTPMAMAMAAGEFGLEDLPGEILENILSCEVLIHIDLARLTCVCRRMKESCDCNSLWKSKFHQRWPKLLQYFCTPGKHYEWKEEYRICLEFKAAVRRKISSMSAEFCRREELSIEAFSEFKTLMEHHEHGYRYVFDELLTIINDGQEHKNLTEKHYTQKAVRFVEHLHLQSEWKRALNLPQNTLSLEEGAVLLARWCQPSLNITAICISDQLDKIADKVKVEIARKHKAHPVLKRELVHLDLPESLWLPNQCRIVLEAINAVMFTELGFRGNKGSYYNAKNSYINKVLSRRLGIPVTLSVVYVSIARRLGVLCESINFPLHFLLRWKEYPQLGDRNMYTYIDAFNGGKFMTHKECVNVLPSPQASLDDDSYNAVTTISVLLRMARNLVETSRQPHSGKHYLLHMRNALEIIVVLQPDDMDARLLLVRVYLHLLINLEEALHHLNVIQTADPTRASTVTYLIQVCQGKIDDDKSFDLREKGGRRIRDYCPEVEFSVGLIVKHKRYGYTCVISGWDSECMADNEWIQQMGVNALPKKQFQPFYNVLVHDGSNRYAAQENLELSSEPHTIRHIEIGRFFSEYHGAYYVLNQETAEEYPQDTECTAKLAKVAQDIFYNN